MSFEITGKVVKIYDVESKSATFQTREFVIVTEDTYPQYVKFQLSQDRVSIMDRFTENQEVKVSFDLRGREWQGKYFTNLNAWKVEGASNAAAQPPTAPFPDENIEFESNSSFDDMPF